MTVIAIDGPAGSGKTTVARAVAARLGLEYLDTGAMYRAVALVVLRNNLDPHQSNWVIEASESMDLQLRDDRCLVDGVDVTSEIRGPEVTQIVSTVAAIPELRAQMVDRQRAWVDARGGGVVEGRDIGSVVLPNADAKVYLTASSSVRARRRTDQNHSGDVDVVAAEIRRRDEADTDRKASPLIHASGAVEIDTTDIGIEETVEQVLDLLG